MTRFVAITAAGGLSAALVAGLLASRDRARYRKQAAELAATLEARGAALETYMTTRGAEIERELRRMAAQETREQARARAVWFVETVLMLTPERQRQVERVGELLNQLPG